MHYLAGQRGIGVLTFENYFGFDYLQECIDAYRKGLAEGGCMGRVRNEFLGLYVATAFCAPTQEEAVRIAKDVVLGYFKFILDLYIPLGKRQSYQYLDAKMQRLLDHENDMDYLLTQTPSVMVGTPADFIARIGDLKARGVDEVLLRVDGVAHEEIMKSIDLIGKEVIPHVTAGTKAVAA